ncbi:MAG TPA: VIT1/CCC1 transporter family protein [Polyangia bacterium]|nr:VIT1/CCC1 transporter family protein [Polyangia bacterium]
MSARKSWAQEMESAYLYEVLADSDPAPERRALFAKLAGEARGQAATWAAEVQRVSGESPRDFRPSARARFVAALVRRLGPRRLRGVLSGMKVRGMSIFRQAPGHAMPHSVDEIGRRHRREAGGDTLRPAVFGASDGLVSNLCLILGVAGASAGWHGRAVLVSGVAGLLAGAFSMAAGEYISVRSQREMFEHQIGAERAELAEYPEQEAAELSLIYQARGLDKPDADRAASHLISNPEQALDTLAREELGLDPAALGSPTAAAVSSFASFAAGAAVPLAPFVIAAGPRALAASVGLTAAALFGVGCAISLFTGRGALASGARMLVVGGAAGAVTYAIGRLVGAAVG